MVEDFPGFVVEAWVAWVEVIFDCCGVGVGGEVYAALVDEVVIDFDEVVWVTFWEDAADVVGSEDTVEGFDVDCVVFGIEVVVAFGVVAYTVDYLVEDFVGFEFEVSTGFVDGIVEVAFEVEGTNDVTVEADVFEGDVVVATFDVDCVAFGVEVASTLVVAIVVVFVVAFAVEVELV